MSPLPPDDNSMFDRLADGELAADQQRELLASLDGHPDGWRQCALALLEAQTWRNEFKSFLRTEAPPAAVQVEAAAPSQLPARPVRWFALAASTLLAFGLGWGLQSQRGADDLSNQVAATSKGPAAEPRLPEPDFPAEKLPDSRDAVTLVVRDIEGRNQRVRLPLLDGATFGDQWAQISPVPEELRAGLKNRGFDVRRERRYAPLFFEQDQGLVPMVVPVDDTYVVPVNRPVY